MLYVTELLPKDMCYVWDTDDLTIERVSTRDVGMAIASGIEFENVQSNIHLSKVDFDKNLRFCLVTRITNARKPKGDITSVVQVAIQHPPLLFNFMYNYEDIGCIMGRNRNGYLTLWYNDILYRVPIHYSVDIGGATEHNTTMGYAIGKYKNCVKFCKNSLYNGMKDGITFKDGNIYLTNSKKPIKDCIVQGMGKRVFNRKLLMGEFN